MKWHDKAPDGKFIGRGDVLFHWLPLIQDWAYGDGVIRSLEILALLCRNQAVMRLRWHAKNIESGESMEDTYQMRQYEKELKRRAILLQAAKDIQAL